MTGFFNSSTRPGIATLVIIAGAGALNMTIILPALSDISAYFDAPIGLVQLLVSAYLGMNAVLQLIIGPLSDRYGRRPVMIVCLMIMLIATLVCIFAPSIEILLLGRMLQTSIVAGVALSRAVVRDIYDHRRAASMMGYVTMGMSVVPMIGPAIGGFLNEYYGWQSTFWISFAFSTIVLIVVMLDMGETNEHKIDSFRKQFAAYPELLRSRRFWGYSLAAAFTSGSFFAFLGGGPFVARDILGMSSSEFGIYFILTSVGYMLGNFLTALFSTRFGMSRMILAGNLISAVGMVVAMLAFKLGHASPIALFGPMTFIGFGNGMSLPNANAGIVSVRPRLAGSASGLGGALMIGGGAVMSVISGSLLSPQTGPDPMLIVIFLSSIAGAAAALYVMRVERLVEKEKRLT